MQLCPLFNSLPSIQDLTALSISASSKIRYGSLPPSSRTIFFNFFAAIFATALPAFVLPVTATP